MDRNPIERAFEREMERIRETFGTTPDDAEPMEWEEAMSKPLELPIQLSAGGHIHIKINHDERAGFAAVRLDR